MPGISLARRLKALSKNSEQGEVAVNRDVSLRFCKWTPVAPRGRMLLLTGRGGFVEKYYQAVIRLLERNLEVVSFDWRGQGLSTRLVDNPQLGHIDDFSDYLDDLNSIAGRFFQASAVSANYLLAHSMGAHIAMRWLREEQPGRAFRHAWLTAPLVGLDTRPFPRVVAKTIAAVVSATGGRTRYVLGGGPFDERIYRQQGLAKLTSDQAQIDYEIEQLNQNPALRLGSPTFGWLNAAFKSVSILQGPGYIEPIVQPLTQFVADDEQVVDNAAIARLDRRLSQSEWVRVAGVKHDMLVETAALQTPIWDAVDRQLAADFCST